MSGMHSRKKNNNIIFIRKKNYIIQPNLIRFNLHFLFSLPKEKKIKRPISILYMSMMYSFSAFS